MFKNSSIWQVLSYAVIAALISFTAAATAMNIYETETRPWGHECKAGDTKPRTKESFEADCYRGYWEYWAPVP